MFKLADLTCKIENLKSRAEDAANAAKINFDVYDGANQKFKSKR